MDAHAHEFWQRLLTDLGDEHSELRAPPRGSESRSRERASAALVPGGRGVAPHLQRRLPRGCRPGGELTLGIPGLPPGWSAAWMGARLVWWPGGRPRRERVGVASSRLPRPLHRYPDWFAELRRVASSLDTRRQQFVTCRGTTADRFVRRAAGHYGQRLLEIVLPGDDLSCEAWFAAYLAGTLAADRKLAPDPFSGDGRLQGGAAAGAAAAARWECVFVSPPLTAGEHKFRPPAEAERERPEVASTRGDPRQDPAPPPAGSPLPDPRELEPLPLRDRILSCFADRLVVLASRPRGVTAAVTGLRTRLGAGEGTRVLDCGRRRPSGSAASTPARPMADPRGGGFGKPVAASPTGQLAGRAAHNWPWSCGDWLTHCTRARYAPWPGQSEAEYIDALLFGRPDAVRSPCATLRRILSERRLRASAEAIRGGFPMVCFTECLPHRLADRRKYRRHRRRWDFLGYGVAVRRDWLVTQHDAAPVVYGDQRVWEQLPKSREPYFQLARGKSGEDWTVEREWRIRGDVPLTMPADALVVFAPNRSEAETLRPLSPWPVVALGQQ